MIIRDLEQLEVVSEDKQVEGGYTLAYGYYPYYYNSSAAYADAGSIASASGWNSSTRTSASTITQTSGYSSFSGSGANSVAFSM